MLRSINQLYGHQLGATDGEIGRVKDFYFDDQDWTIRYLVADTGSWLAGRQVLLTPYSLGLLDASEKILRVNLTRKQIEDSPSIEAHKPMSREHEEEYYRYYGWPRYWQGAGRWGASGVPNLEPSAKALPGEPTIASGQRPERSDAHLWSAQAVNGYQVRTGEETLGHICDFMMDAQSWALGQLTVRTGHRLSGKEVLIETKNIERISHQESTVFANLTTDKPSPANTQAVEVKITRPPDSQH
jgi:hypothetical protein